MKRLMCVIVCVAVVLAVGVAVPTTAAAGNDVAISIVEFVGDRYIDPVNDTFVAAGRPIRFHLRILNTTDTTINVRADPNLAYSIEFKDASGRTTVMKRKWKLGEKPQGEKLKTMAPGTSDYVSIEIDAAAWEGIPALTPGEEQTFKVRAIYQNESGHYRYSKTYTAVFR